MLPVHNFKKPKSGFTLITLSIILTVASLVFVATLPGIQTSLKANSASVVKMHYILDTMRGYMAANGVLPCPADPTQAIGANNYGVAAANPGTANNCMGGTPAAAYADTTNHIAIGMVPVKTLGLSYADALDGYGRDITYAVDTNATGNSSGASCWSSNSLTGAVTINDNGTAYNTVATLVSHGADGYGAWLPLSGTSGIASRFDNGSTDISQAANAQVATGGGLSANSTFVSFVRKSATATFDDSLVYKSNLYALNTLPTSVQVYPTVTPPSNGSYNTGQVLTFTVIYASALTVTGTPRLTLSALSSGSIGTGNMAYATYQSGSGTATLIFKYTVQSGDSAPTNGITMNSYIDLNGGNISGGSVCFNAPDLSSILINPPTFIYVADSGNNRIQLFDSLGNYKYQFGTSGTGNNQYNNPNGIFADNTGNVWVADTSNNRIQKISVSASGTATFISQLGTGVSGSLNTQFASPVSVVVDNNGNIWVTDKTNNRVQKFASNGTYLLSVPSSGSNTQLSSSSANGYFNAPLGIAIDSGNNIWVGDSGNNRVEKFDSNGTYIMAVGAGYNGVTGSIGSSGAGNGKLSSPHGVAIDSGGNIWVGDNSNDRIEEFTSAGAYAASLSTATSSHPRGISMDQSGNIWTANKGNNTISKCVPSVSCTAYGTSGSGNGQLNLPYAVSFPSR